jgi:hypothetical protein
LVGAVFGQLTFPRGAHSSQKIRPPVQQIAKGEEESCVINLRAIIAAENDYWGGDPTKGYSRSLKKLLLEPVSLSGKKDDYHFTFTPEPTAPGKPVRHYTISVRPIRRVIREQMSLFADDSGVIRFTTENRAATRNDPAINPAMGSLALPGAFFDYHSGFWVNLHHFLCEEADARGSQTQTIPFEPETAEDEKAHASLSPKERKRWQQSVEYYESKVIEHDLLKDPEMEKVKNRLEDLEDSASLRGSGLDPGLVAALDRAAPVYMAHWWPQHDKENQAWIAAVSPLVERDGARLSREIATAYDAVWPNRRVRVDVTAYANWAGAYTSLFPTRLTISSTDPANQGAAALEVVFHESSHALIDKVLEAISKECKNRNVLLPRRDLWHAVLFFTAGYYVQELNAGYLPYADKNGLWARAWPMYRAPLVQDWQPHLEGKSTLQAAIARLVADVGVPRKVAP